LTSTDDPPKRLPYAGANEIATAAGLGLKRGRTPQERCPATSWTDQVPSDCRMMLTVLETPGPSGEQASHKDEHDQEDLYRPR